MFVFAGEKPECARHTEQAVSTAIAERVDRAAERVLGCGAEERGTIRCIYTDRELGIGDYAVEHFIPYSFVSHDLIWNLIPADPIFNSAKSNKLPSFDTYFDAFFQLQKDAIGIVSQEKPNSRYLEDYLTILPDLGYGAFEEETVKEKFKQTIQPLLTIAANNGFQYL